MNPTHNSLFTSKLPGEPTVLRKRIGTTSHLSQTGDVAIGFGAAFREVFSQLASKAGGYSREPASSTWCPDVSPSTPRYTSRCRSQPTGESLECSRRRTTMRRRSHQAFYCERHLKHLSKTGHAIVLYQFRMVLRKETAISLTSGDSPFRIATARFNLRLRLSLPHLKRILTFT